MPLLRETITMNEAMQSSLPAARPNRLPCSPSSLPLRYDDRKMFELILLVLEQAEDGGLGSTGRFGHMVERSGVTTQDHIMQQRGGNRSAVELQCQGSLRHEELGDKG